MFDRCRAHPTVDADRLRSQAADAGAALSVASARAGQTAGALAHQAKDAAAHAKEWAAPRVEQALREGKKAAAPKVELAAEKALPLVDRTHDRLVDDVLPKLVVAVNAAAAAAAIGADKARDLAAARLTELAHVPPPKKSRTGAKVFWSIAGLAVVGAVLAILRRSRPSTDPWAEDPWEDDETQLPIRTDAVRNGLADAADAVGEVAGEAVAVARDTTEKVKETTEKVAEKVAETTRKVTRRAAPADDAETAPADDAGSTPEEAATKPRARRSPNATAADKADDAEEPTAG